MEDFETHERGTGRELRLSRELACVLARELAKPQHTIPPSVAQAYQRLKNLYDDSSSSVEIL
jgi:hypothetical protein